MKDDKSLEASNIRGEVGGQRKSRRDGRYTGLFSLWRKASNKWCTLVSGTYTKIINNQNTIVLYLRGFCSPLKDDSEHWVRCTSVCISSSDSDSSLTKCWKTDDWPSMLFCKEKMQFFIAVRNFMDFYSESFKFHLLAVRLKQKLPKTDTEN